MSSSKHPASVGAYSIIRELGRGGMGVVYLARDTRLERQVAIKALPAHLSADPDRLARFEREARILASLNHPNIAAIHGLEESAGHRYLILEHVEGLTLAQRLERGPLALEDALDAARQIALALEAAHEKGVIHRDLKPGNVMLRGDGAVKVLDFGLARTAEGAPSSTGASPDSPTISSPAAPVHSPTIPGAIMGTAGYMSPEQARGKPVDKRSDIFSFGCVLYEMLTGAGPFSGETVTDAIGALLHREPEWSLLPRDTPPAISLLLLRCLAKDKSKRLHDIADARIELEQPHAAALSIEARGARRVSAPAVAGLIAALGLAGAGGGVLGARLLRPTLTASVQLDMAAPAGVLLISAGDVAGPATISPDGSSVAFVAHEKDATARIWVRRLDSAESQPLAGTELATFPFWSPDSRSLAFFVDGKLRRVDLDTRTVSTICEARAGRGGAWMANGVIVFTPDFQAPLSRVDAGGGTPVAITQLDAARHTSHRWPCALPDGRRFLFSAVHHEPGHDEDAGIYLGSLDGAAPRRVMQNSCSVGYANGRMLFVSEGTLSAVRLDLHSGRLTETPRPVLRGVATDPSVWRASFSVSTSGALAYHRAAPATGPAKQAANASGGSATPQGASATRLIRYRRDGRPANIVLDDTPQNSLGVSPDEKHVVTALFGGGADGWDLWRFSLVDRLRDLDEAKPAPERLTFLRGLETSPVWSPDATEIAFCVAFGSPEQPKGVYRKRIGGGDQRLILEEPSEQLSAFPSDWSADGRHLIYARGSWVDTGDSDILALPLEGGGPIPLVATPANEFSGRLSPDGKWLAYASAETANTSEVYVIPFAPARAGAAADPGAPARSAGNERWRVSIAGGDSPAWRKDGKELFFMNNSGVLMAVGVRSEGDSIAFDTGKPLFQTGWTSGGKAYAVLYDGDQFLVQEDVATDASAPISVVLQWPALLKP